jgi:hypothetical protein
MKCLLDRVLGKYWHSQDFMMKLMNPKINKPDENAGEGLS